MSNRRIPSIMRRRGTRGIGGFARSAPPVLYALTGFTSANYYATPSGGGEAGPGVSSWGLATLLRVRAFQASEHQRIAVRGVAGGLGWHQYLFTTNQIVGYFNSGAGWTNTGGPTLQPSDLGKLLLLVTWLDAGGVARLALSRAEVATVGGTSASYTAQSGPHAIGYSPADGTNGAQTIDVLGHLSFAGAPNTAQLQALFDAVRGAGDLPTSFAGVTLRHRWSLREQLLKAGGAVVSGQTAPAQLDDTVTGAVGDVMTRVGAPTVRVIDPSVDGRRTYGAQGFNASSYLASALGAGIRGSAAGYAVVYLVRMDAVPGTTQVLGGCANVGASNGHMLQATSASLRALNGGSPVSGTYTIVAADVGRLMVIAAVYTGAVLRLYVDAVQAGADVAASFVAPTGSEDFRLGSWSGGQFFSSGSVLAAMGGDIAGGASLAQVQQVQANFAATGKLVPFAGIQHLYDPTLDVAGNGGPDAGVPAQALDRIGTDHLSRVGSGLTVAQRAERVWSHETSPILRGAQAFSAGDYFEHATGVAGDPVNGLFVAVLLVVRSQAVPSTGRVLLSRRSTGNSGWNVSTNATNSTITATLSTTTSTYGTPALSIAAGDVGKLQLFAFQLDVPALKLRGYGKRAELASGSSILGTYVPYAGTMQVGRRNGDVVPADTGIEIYGFTCGESLLTLAEIQALHDACMAGEDIASVPGKSLITVSLKQDIAANNGAIPATLLDRKGTSNFTRAGAPALASQFSRMWGW